MRDKEQLRLPGDNAQPMPTPDKPPAERSAQTEAEAKPASERPTEDTLKKESASERPSGGEGGAGRAERSSAADSKRVAPDRGGAAEESLRSYFLDAGFFVVRGGKVRFLDGEVTDVDLWLYGRPSRVSRERACVDAKWKQAPKALERIVWAKGLQSMLGVERAIVATPDAREIVRAFGAKHHVSVLDGGLFAEIHGRKASAARISQEELLASLHESGAGKIGGDWRGAVELAASRVVSGLDFDAVNELLERVRFFIEKAVASRSPAACRATYLVTAFFLVSIDYCITQLAFATATARRASVVDGLRFGQKGARRTREAVEMSTKLVASYAPGLRERIHADLRRQYDAIPAEGLADYLLKQTVQEQLFELAKGFEAQAFAFGLTRPSNLETSAQSVLGAILDFLKIDRNSFFNAV